MKVAPADMAALEDRHGQAAEWYLRLRGGLSVDELLDLAEWRSNPENQSAFERVRSVSPMHGDLKRPRPATPQEIHDDPYEGEVSIAHWLARSPRADQWDCLPSNDIRKGVLHQKRGPRPIFTSAAGLRRRIAAIIVIAFVLPTPQSADLTLSMQRFETAGAQNRVIHLSDSSQIVIGPRTAIAVRYTLSRRTVDLQRGEALFTVARDVRRPFTVIASGGSITAVGTQFNVRSTSGLVTVTVTEGAVDIASHYTPADSRISPQSLPSGAARVIKGQQAVFSDSDGGPSVDAGDPGAVDWIEGRLQYRRTPLRYVVTDVSRYSDKPIHIVDPAAADCEFTGTLDGKRIGDWVRSLEKIFPIRVLQTGAEVLILSRREASSGCEVNGK